MIGMKGYRIYCHI